MLVHPSSQNFTNNKEFVENTWIKNLLPRRHKTKLGQGEHRGPLKNMVNDINKKIIIIISRQAQNYSKNQK